MTDQSRVFQINMERDKEAEKARLLAGFKRGMKSFNTTAKSSDNTS
jgi:hypothetical protein